MTMGVAAAERCNDFGWHPRGEIDSTLVAETLEQPRFGVGHAWSRSAGYALTTAPERIYLVLTMEGGFEFTVDGQVIPTQPGSLILLNGEAPTTARTVAQTSRYVWYLEPTFLTPGKGRFQYGEPLPTSGASIQMLMGMTNSLLQSPPPSTEAGQRHLSLAFENILAAALDETAPRRPRDIGQRRDGLFMAAHSVIETRFRDPAFTVSRLAQELAVSERTLRDTFHRMGTTARREIERRRLTEATQLEGTEPLTATERALRSGFSSAQQLARALTRVHRIQ
ncbi:helix-turn-helix domain-containing protein [Curtobacterium sp. L1-20]|uniref:AraC family transcriptional regulator n=1 Tax=Curtobacterium sp. L1-20 TaxID=3138181 RepID=UPI003B529B5E